MKNLFSYIAKKSKKRNTFTRSEEFRYFIENRHQLIKLPQFINLYDADNDPFMVMRANIVLYALANKRKIEETANQPNNNNDELPYYEENSKRIYIPFFSRDLNQIYANEPEKLLTSSYEFLKADFIGTLVDPFDTYGNELFNSSFSHLVKITSVDKEAAYFHYDTNTIYFINEQGRLDASIVLFDRYIRHPDCLNILERIKPVIDAYFAFDREGLINALYDNGFISSRLLRLIRFHDRVK